MSVQKVLYIHSETNFFPMGRKEFYDWYSWAMSRSFSISIKWILWNCSHFLVLPISRWSNLNACHCKWRLFSFVAKRKKSNTKNCAHVLTQDLLSLVQDLIKTCQNLRLDSRHATSKKWHDRISDTALLQDVYSHRISTGWDLKFSPGWHHFNQRSLSHSNRCSSLIYSSDVHFSNQFVCSLLGYPRKISCSTIGTQMAGKNWLTWKLILETSKNKSFSWTWLVRQDLCRRPYS